MPIRPPTPCPDCGRPRAARARRCPDCATARRAQRYNAAAYRNLVRPDPAVTICALCGELGADTIDHTNSDSTDHRPANLQPAHRSCNSRKGNK